MVTVRSETQDLASDEDKGKVNYSERTTLVLVFAEGGRLSEYRGPVHEKD